MIESNLLPSTWDPEPFSSYTFRDIAQDDEEFFSSVNIVNNFDDILTLSCDLTPNPSDAECFNFGEFNNDFSLSDEFVHHILGDTHIKYTDVPIDDYCNQNSSPNEKTLKRKRSFDQETLSFKSWSNMSFEDKEKALVSISKITCKMGIREQLEVIKIMDPNFEISADTKEFTLDISLLDDIRWKKIKDFFKKHKIPLSSTKNHKNQQKLKNSKCKKSNGVSRTSRKQRQKKQKVVSETDEYEELKRKQVLQGIKEEKSGLFVYEKVVKFSSLEEDEEVNILE